MAPGTVGLVLAAAVLHVGWNVILKQTGDPLRTAARAMVVAAVVSVPIGLAVGAGGAGDASGAVSPPVVLLAAASGLVEAVYLVLLSAAYRRGDLSVVYPVARGTAPFLATVVGVAALGERLGGPGTVGVLLLLGGICLLVRPWQVVGARGGDARGGDWRRDPAVLAMATGVAIAGYTALDRVAVRLVDPWLYGALVWPSMAIWTLLAAQVAGRRRRRRPGGPDGARRDGQRDPDDDGLGRAVAAGALSYAAYGLVLLALSVAPLTAVAPLRESAVVVASGWGALRMREAGSRADVLVRLGASLAVVAGAAALALG